MNMLADILMKIDGIGLELADPQGDSSAAKPVEHGPLSQRSPVQQLFQRRIIQGAISRETFQHPAIQGAHLPRLDEAVWYRKARRLPSVHRSFSQWTRAVAVGGYVYLIPEDDSPAPDIQLFSRLGGIRGQVRITGVAVDGMTLQVAELRFETDLRCPEGPCDNDGGCGGCCGKCRCVRSLQGDFLMKKCFCPQHH